jgi:hypothetical protein
MKPSLTTIALVLIAFTVISCRPFSKESYLEKYNKFIIEVSEKGADYTEKEWKKADEKYKKFNEDWYKRFKEDLTWQEKATTAKYTLQYTYYRNKTGALDLYNTYIKGDLEKLKEKIRHYKENDMDEDIQNLIKQAKELGDSSVILLDKAIKEVEEEIEGLK